MRSIIVGVSKKRVRGAKENRKGVRIYYKGQKKDWHVYYYDELGLFHADKVSLASVGPLRLRVQRFLSYRCDYCLAKFKSNKARCESCGSSEVHRTRRNN